MIKEIRKLRPGLPNMNFNVSFVRDNHDESELTHKRTELSIGVNLEAPFPRLRERGLLMSVEKGGMLSGQ